MPNLSAWPGASNAIALRRNFLRPEDQITNLNWKPADVDPAAFVAKYGKPAGVKEDWSKKKHLTQEEIGLTLKQRWDVKPPTNCQGCHR